MLWQEYCDVPHKPMSQALRYLFSHSTIVIIITSFYVPSIVLGTGVEERSQFVPRLVRETARK